MPTCVSWTRRVVRPCGSPKTADHVTASTFWSTTAARPTWCTTRRRRFRRRASNCPHRNRPRGDPSRLGSVPRRRRRRRLLPPSSSRGGGLMLPGPRMVWIDCRLVLFSLTIGWLMFQIELHIWILMSCFTFYCASLYDVSTKLEIY